jgi:putative transposase
LDMSLADAVFAPKVRQIVHTARDRLPVRFDVGCVPRLLRTTLPDGYFHVISRGVDGCAIFGDDIDRRTFLVHLRTRTERHGWIVHALCLMTTHYHLVLHSTTIELSRGVQRLNGRYAQQFNQRHVRFGHLFADRFTSRAIESERHLHEACRYVIENPVRAGLCDVAEDWPWAHSRFGDVAEET